MKAFLERWSGLLAHLGVVFAIAFIGARALQYFTLSVACMTKASNASACVMGYWSLVGGFCFFAWVLISAIVIPFQALPLLSKLFARGGVSLGDSDRPRIQAVLVLSLVSAAFSWPAIAYTYWLHKLVAHVLTH
jgi:hypothetical protein